MRLRSVPDVQRSPARRPRRVAVYLVALPVLLLLAALAPPAGAALGDQADLSVTMSQSADRVNVASATHTVTYNITVANNGPKAAIGVVMTDVVGDKSGGAPLPSPLNFTVTQGAAVESVTTTQGACVADTGVRGYPNTVACTLGTLPSSASATVTVVVLPNLNNFVVQQTDGVIANVATVRSDPTGSVDPNVANNVATRTTTVVKYGIGIGDAEVVEGNSGATEVVFTVWIDGATTSTITVNYSTSDGTATTAGADYTATSGTLSFPIHGQSLVPLVTPGYLEIHVPVSGDTSVEPNETFTMTLSGATPSDTPYLYGATATGTIINDD